MLTKLSCALAFVVATALPVRATDVVYNTSVGPIGLGATATASVPKFDPALGVLKRVTIHVEGGVSGTWGVENTSGNPATIGNIAHSDYVGLIFPITLPAGSMAGPNAAFQPSQTALSPFDGTLDYAGTSGVTFQFANQGGDGSPTQEGVVPVDANLPPYIGAGNIAITVGPMIAMNSSLPSNLQSTVSITGHMSIQLRYDYVPFPAPICEANAWSGCPCANDSFGLGGCRNSMSSLGGKLDASGTASLANDSLVLSGSRMTNSSALYFQGSTFNYVQTVYGDGLRCVGGSTVRLGSKMNASGISQYPTPGDLPVSVRGGVTAPGLRYYQVIYRDGGNFCTPSLFNATSGMAVMWTP